MKYISPVYEVETVVAEDIMFSANEMANMVGLKISGSDTQTITENVTIQLTDDNGSTEGISQNPADSEGTGLLISFNFGGLFN